MSASANPIIWNVPGTKALGAPGADMLILEQGTIIAGTVRGGALSDGQALGLNTRLSSPLMPGAIALIGAGSGTGMGALSDSLVAGLDNRLKEQVPLKGLLSLLYGEDGGLFAVDPVVESVKSCLSGGQPFQDGVRHFSTLFMSAGLRIHVGAILAGGFGETQNRHLIISSDLPLSQTVLWAVLTRLRTALFLTYRLHGVDHAADTLVLAATGKTPLTYKASDEELTDIAAAAYAMAAKTLLTPLFEKEGWTLRLRVAGAQNAEECEKLITAIAGGIRRIRNTDMTPAQRWQLLRLSIARSGIDTLAREDLTLITPSGVLVEEGRLNAAPDAQALWHSVFDAGEPLTWQLVRGSVSLEVTL